MEEPLFLVTVQRQIGGIEIEDDLPGWLGEGFKEQVEQKAIDGVRIAVDLFVASGFGGASLEAIQGALAGQGLVGVPFAGEQAEQGIVAPLVMIVEIFVAEGEAVDSLGEHLFDGVLDVARVAVIAEAGGEAGQEVEFGGGLAQEQGSAVGGGGRAAEVGNHRPAVVRRKRELGLGTLCHSKSRSPLDCNCLFRNSVMPQRTAFCQ
jgi:hypothetical protein